MATKTLILRPVKVTCDDESLVTPTPNDTTIDNWHLLVNEEVRDDNSTYLLCKSPSNVSYHFNYIKPIDMQNIVGFNLHIVDKCNNAVTTTFSYTLFLVNNYVLPNFSRDTNTSWATEDKIITANQSDSTNIFNELNSVSDFYVTQGLSSGNMGNKVGEVLVTQVYIEIIYESVDIIYFKSNDIWMRNLCPGVYSKNNVEWVKLKSSAESFFDNSSKYRIKEVD